MLVYLARLSLITARVPRPGGKQREDDEEKYGILILICRRYPGPSKTLSTEAGSIGSARLTGSSPFLLSPFLPRSLIRHHIRVSRRSRAK